MSDRPGPVIAGNWKMHHGPGATREFFRRFRPRFDRDPPTLLVFPPAISLPAARESVPDDPPVELGVQNIHWEDSGAYTGEVSAGMAAEAGAGHVLVGHSERRHVFGETDDEVARKVRAAVRHELVPVICVGETLEQREDGRVDEVVTAQLDAALEPLVDAGAPPFMVAYEPVWAIGTGESAEPEQAQEMHAVLRNDLTERYGTDVADGIPLLYGGSMKPHNAYGLLSQPDIDGGLIGSASLAADSFLGIAERAIEVLEETAG